MKKKYEYIEIVKTDNNEVVRRFDVTGRTENRRNMLIAALANNFDNDKYFIKEVNSDKELPLSRHSILNR